MSVVSQEEVSLSVQDNSNNPDSDAYSLHQEEQKIKQQLKTIPYGEIIKYQIEQRKDSQQRHKQKQRKGQKRGTIKVKRPKAQATVSINKNSAREISIIRKPLKTQPKNIFDERLGRAIDPRFESYTGAYKPDLVSKSYSFIKDIQQQEAQQLKKEIKNPKLEEEDKQILLKNYNRVTNQIKSSQLSELENSVKKKFQRRGFHLKKSRFREELEKEKMRTLSRQEQDKRLKKKQKKIRKQQTIERKIMQQAMNRH